MQTFVRIGNSGIILENDKEVNQMLGSLLLMFPFSLFLGFLLLVGAAVLFWYFINNPVYFLFDIPIKIIDFILLNLC